MHKMTFSLGLLAAHGNNTHAFSFEKFMNSTFVHTLEEDAKQYLVPEVEAIAKTLVCDLEHYLAQHFGLPAIDC